MWMLIWRSICWALAIYTAFKYKTVLHWMRNFRSIVVRDFFAALLFVRVHYNLAMAQYLDLSVDQVFEKTAARNRNKVCIHFEDVSWTFERMSRYSNQVANALYKLGFRSGDEVSLMMDNRPEFIGLWLGCSKLGVTPAMINTNQKGSALVHAITCVQSKALLFGTEHTQAVHDVLEPLQNKLDLQYLCLGDPIEVALPAVARSLEPLIADASPINHHRPSRGYKDTLFYIFTSGTTGLPKASRIRHCRVFMAAYALAGGMGLHKADVLYTPLPFYHASGGILGTCPMLFFGCTMVTRRKFSASRFWTDCVRYNCTASIYIGELCRYLLNQPERPEERQHRLRIIFGNGLRPNLWKPMRTRFRIPYIVEFFGSTEGNTSLINYSNKDGACGFLPQLAPDFLLHLVYPVKIVKYDENRGEVVRDSRGFCVLCGPNETGMLVSKINNSDPIQAFDGYTNQAETEKKMLFNAFTPGDCIFLSGDLLYMDDLGFLYFRDRTGDTFRWKGENVSTTEVETVISSLIELAECVCFGVEVPGHEGRACMVAVVQHPEHPLQLDDLLRRMKLNLPPYAIPVFIRLIHDAQYTATFKLQKVQLKQQAYDSDLIKDPVFMLNENRTNYDRIDSKLMANIRNSNVRL